MILELKNIRLKFGRGPDAPKILNGLNLNVEPGKITAMIGGNGVGKTTLFNIISGFQRGYTGTVRFNGRPIGNMAPHRISRLGIGRLFQGKPLLPDLSLLENMKLASSDRTGEFPFSHLFRKKALEKAETEKGGQAVDILNRLFGQENQYIGELDREGGKFSHGQQRLLSLAGLFMGDYSLLLLDEPTAGVNPKYFEALKEIIRKMVADGRKTVLLIEHNMPFVAGMADNCVYLEDGAIAEGGKTADVLGKQSVRNSYMGIE